MRNVFWATLALGAFTAQAASLNGYWAGTIVSKGHETAVQLEFTETGDTTTGQFWIPEFGWISNPFAEVTVQRAKFRALRETDPVFGFEGTLSGKGEKQRLSGDFVRGDFRASFSVERTEKPELPYAIEEVRFQNGDTTLAGAVYAPKSPGRHGAVVLLHGSGDNERWQYFETADWFARHNMVCLVFDKRGNGASTGKWLDVGFTELADDGIAGLRHLQTRSDVDPAKIGFWGISQAGWIMEIAAQRCADTAFFVSISGGTAQVEREGYWDYECDLRAAGHSEAEIAEAIDMLRRYNATVRTGEGYEAFLEWMQPMRQKPWFAKLAWVPRPPDRINQQWYRRVMDFDPEPVLRGLNLPMLFIFGEADDSNPTAEGIAMLNKVKAETGKDLTIISFPGADHGVRFPADPAAAYPFRKRPEAFWTGNADWLRQRGVMAP